MFNPFTKRQKKSAAPARSETARIARTERALEIPSKPTATKSGDKKERRLIGVLSSPHKTEKASAGALRGWYTFRVNSHANKISVRRAVEERYGVSVERVRVSNSRPKSIRLGQIRGQTPGFKKAMVKVRA